ncbi:hypothetical protein L6164_021026 [Bauhinia variegata]|uniref:Uncharacterized protein n=1 Tax=Bauhinia variegata TaxID=167791 RepID=A0ACB9MYE0_BAUVA|nr:hypothetical protein L6164_021026 [Bauhinia variegata]
MAADNEKRPDKVLHYWLKISAAKSPLFIYVIIFFVIFLLIYALSIMSHPSPLLFGLRSHQTPIEVQTLEEDCESDQDPLVPPRNIPREERIAWFKTQLPKLDILKPSNSSETFHFRVLSFLNQGCSTLFHMIWLTPAKSFGKREFLTMETLFKVNPQACLVILSSAMDSRRGYKILKPLLDRRFKVLAITPDLPFLVKRTPAQAWLEEIKSGTKDPGSIPLSQNLSNLIRLAMLYKYGGVYMDTDLIVLKDFSVFRNAIGAQSVDSVTKKWNRLNSAIMIFDIRHPILLEFLKEFASTFDGNRWGHNGPYLVSRVIERLERKSKYNVTILPPKTFYPVDWLRIGKLFRKPQNEAESKWMEDRLLELLYTGETYAVHLWNKMSKKLVIEEGSVMARLLTRRCVLCDNTTNT